MSDQAPIANYISNTDKIYDALAKAQGEFPVIEKNSKVDVYSKPPNRTLLYSYMYADLTEIINKTRPSLSKNGISFTQGMGSEGFYTRIMHSSGQCFDTGIIPTQIKANDYKEMAGAVTYLKRISLSAALGISADEDIDAAESEAKQGNSTTKQESKPKGGYDPNKTKKNEVKNLAPNPIDVMFQAYQKKGVTMENIIEYFGYKSKSQITEKDINTLRNLWKSIVSGEVSVHDLFIPAYISQDPPSDLDFAPFDEEINPHPDELSKILDERQGHSTEETLKRIARERGVNI